MNEETTFPRNNRREIFGWMLYDWANSAFYTTVIGVLLGPYLVSLSQAAVGEDGTILDLFFFRVTPKGYQAFCLAISVISLVIFLPILGAIADYTHLKKKLLAIFCYAGVISSSLLFFATGDSYIFAGILLIISNMTFAAANVFYNAFLIDITTEDKRDKVSSYGYAAGYIGGVLMLVLNILLISNAEKIGISQGLAVRISFLGASLWWAVFGIISFSMIKSRGASKSIPQNTNLVTIGFKELWQTLKELVRLKYTARFLISYLFYNDGIQTVILQSSVFISYELFTSKGLPENNSILLAIFIVAQFSAFIGALVFQQISKYIGAKNTILVSLMIWCGIVFYAYFVFSEMYQVWIMGAFIGLVLGSTQALSRSLFSQMIPAGRESSFFGLYEISEKGTSWMGQLLFVIVVGITNSYRQAILALIVFFVIGSLILLFTDTTKAIHEAGNLTPEEAAKGN